MNGLAGDSCHGNSQKIPMSLTLVPEGRLRHGAGQILRQLKGPRLAGVLPHPSLALPLVPCTPLLSTSSPRQKIAISSSPHPRERHGAGKTNRPFLLWLPAGDGWPEGLAALMDDRPSCVG